VNMNLSLNIFESPASQVRNLLAGLIPSSKKRSSTPLAVISQSFG
jgi:hypothetical protein